MITKLIKNAKIIFYDLSCHGNENKLAQKKNLFLSQNSKTKYLLKIKTVNKCSLTA